MMFGKRSREAMAFMLAAATTFAWAVPTSWAGQYRFTKIADTSERFRGFGGFSINDGGTVAFFGSLGPRGDGVSAVGIFTSSGGSVTTITDNVNGPFNHFYYASEPSINNAGTVAFLADVNEDSQGIFTSNGEKINKIADINGPYRYFPIAPRINNAGAVAFFADLDTGPSGIVSVKDGQTTIIALAIGEGGLQSIGDPESMNDDGTVVFLANDSVGSRQIFKSNGGLPTSITATLFGLQPVNPFSSQSLKSASINNAGTVAFKADLLRGGPGIFIGTGGPITSIADTTGPFSSFGDFPSINDNGEVAFLASARGLGLGIFLGPEPVSDRVIMAGDHLDGSTVTGISVHQDFLNNNGQLAFLATLADGRQGIFRADPDLLVPEPSMLTLTLPMVYWATGRRGRRARS